MEITSPSRAGLFILGDKVEQREVLKTLLSGGQVSKEDLLEAGLSREQLERLAVLRGERERLKKDGGIWLYAPQTHKDEITDKDIYQDAFHRSLKKIRWIFGGNKSAKSYPTKAESTWWATGEHPYRKVPSPVRGWVVSLDFPSSRDVSERLLQHFIPKSRLVKWDSSKGQIFVKSKNRESGVWGISEITLKSCDSGVTKFQGADLDFEDFDEEPPYDIWKECKPRLWVRNGSMWCAETPTLGMTWTQDEIIDKVGIDPKIQIFNFDSRWNKYLNREELESEIKQMDRDEFEIRILGKPIQLSGQIFKNFRVDVHVIEPFNIPNNIYWTKYRSLDHGLHNPTANLWIAFDKENDMYIYNELYETEKTIEENCYAIKTISADDKYTWSTIDGSTKTRKADDKFTYYDIYKKFGFIAKPIWLTEERISNAINETNQRMKIDEKTHKPRIFIFKTCFNTIKEISRYRWKTFRKQDDRNVPEKPQDSMNHAITAIFFNILSNARYIPPEYDYGERDTVNQGWYTGSYARR